MIDASVAFNSFELMTFAIVQRKMLQRLLPTLCKQKKILFQFDRHIIRNYLRNMSLKSALVLIAPGSEEIEAVVTVDVLRRGGVAVTLAGVSGSQPIECSRQVNIVPDASLDDAAKKGPYDVVILPGGLGGTKNFIESAAVGSVLKEQEAAGRIIAAICAAPTALKAHAIGLGKRVTAYPHESIEGDMQEGSKYNFVRERVVVDGKLITSQGPGTAFEFALAILVQLNGKEAADRVAAPLILQGKQ